MWKTWDYLLSTLFWRSNIVENLWNKAILFHRVFILIKYIWQISLFSTSFFESFPQKVYLFPQDNALLNILYTLINLD